MITGCRPAERPVPDQRPVEESVPPDGVMGDPNAPLQQPEMRNTDPNNPMRNPNRQDTGQTADEQGMMDRELTLRADNIVNEVVKLDEVQSATVVITDNMAIVGVNLTSPTKGDMNTEIKRKVEETVKTADQRIERVSVTADPDIFERIENIAREAGRGRPLSGFGREIEELIRRITPGA